MKFTRQTETITIEGTPAEIRELFSLAGYALPDDVDPQSLTHNDSRRYIESGRVGDYGEREACDVRTGRKGVFMMESIGVGFVPGARITESGAVEFEHPWDNPFYGCRF